MTLRVLVASVCLLAAGAVAAETGSSKAVAQATKPPPPTPADIDIKLDTSMPKGSSKELSLDIPTFDDIDAKVLKDVSLCIFPFLKEDKVAAAATPGKPAGQNLERIQKIFYDVAQSSPLLRNSKVIGKDAPICGIEDVSCVASLGGFTGCTAVLTGRATREDNGFTLRARMIDTKNAKLIGKVNQVIATDDESEMAAWAEGQACRALKVNCSAQVKLDADRADMTLLIDGRPFARKPSIAPGVPETIDLSPGLYKIRAMIGQRNSRELTLAVRRNQTDVIIVRQTEDGGIPIYLKSELKPGEAPGPSKELKRGGLRGTQVAGIVAASLGVVGVGVGAQQYFHSKSLVSDANASYDANGGFYTPEDVSNINSAKSAHSNSTIFTAVGIGLVVVGGVLFFAF